MRVAIVAPQPAPLAMGGAENLFAGLQDAIREAGHVCDLVGQISPEGSLREVLTSYLAFSQLDLADYDCVISGKYPAWLAPHRDHRIYMLHRLRGLYDTYPGGRVGRDLSALPEIAALRLDEEGRSVDLDLPSLRRSIEALLARDEAELPPGAFSYPGPLARALVHALDRASMSRAAITRYAAISGTVARRVEYFPSHARVAVLHPPPHRNDYHCRDGRYFFTSSRLDGPKRIALLIEAMAHVEADIPLLIAGTGPQRERLEDLADGDERIRFLGFVPDDEMPALYADALAVPFVPYDEDYGLVTIEAMKSAKPVLTTSDSGGPCEFVRDGVTGLVCAPDAVSIGAALNRLASDPQSARAMGAAAARAVSGVTWERVVTGLLGTPASQRYASRGGARSKKLVVATTMPIYPPQGGGQARIFHLYRHLAQQMDVDIVSFGPPGEGTRSIEIAPGLKEIRVGKTTEHDRLERRLMGAMADIPIGDVVMPRLSALTPAYREALSTAGRSADVFVACHPYLAHEIAAVARGRPVWYEAQDVEWILKRQVFGDLSGHEAILNDIWTAERRCWLDAKLVIGCTASDLAALRDIYGPTSALTVEAPNGVALDEIAFTPMEDRLAARRRYGFDERTVALFLGSWHPPNLDAVEFILGLAPAMPDVLFLVAGSAGLPFMNRELPQNVRLMGGVSSETRSVLLASADLAINPMSYGSGSNLKMLDYFAAGVPVVSTTFGARGLAVTDGVHARLCELDGFATAIRAVGPPGQSGTRTMLKTAYELVSSHYDWAKIAADLAAFSRASKLI